jgi:acetoin utilization deacetylase AcuC-like enzyme
MYAHSTCRHAGIQRVAILDFDVHHGNGTRACVSNTAPGTLRVPFTTPMSEGVHVYHTYQPWFDVDDDDNVLFASVQGYGPKATSVPGNECLSRSHLVAALRSCVHICWHVY